MSEKAEGAYYVVIPGFIRGDARLSAYAKLLYGEIAVKCTARGFCWATNNFFADIFGCNVRSIQRYIKELEDAGHITMTLQKSGDGTERKLFLMDASHRGMTNKTPGGTTKKTRPHVKKDIPGHVSNVIHTKKTIDKEKVINIPLSTNVDKGADNPGAKEKGCFQKFNEIYNDWFKGFNDGVPPRFDGANGNAAKSLINYLKKIVRDKAAPEILDDPGAEKRALEAWAHVLKNWHKLDNFLQAKTRLIDINSNIQNIITTIKNGNGKQKQSTGGDVSISNIANAINEHYR